LSCLKNVRSILKKKNVRSRKYSKKSIKILKIDEGGEYIDPIPDTPKQNGLSGTYN